MATETKQEKDDATEETVAESPTETVGDVTVKVQLLHPAARVPERAHDGDAGFDLRALEAGSLSPGETRIVQTGVAIELPPGTVGLCCSRSGLAAKHGIISLNAPGIIDSGYRGDVSVILHNVSKDYFRWAPGDRIGQLLVMTIPALSLETAEGLGESERGTGGFGSTGAA